MENNPLVPVPGQLSDPMAEQGGRAAEAPWDRVTWAAPEAWVEPAVYDAQVAKKEGAHKTQLLWERQVQAETGRSFHASAVRLETGEAVQHQSQWSLEFDAERQRVVLHWLRVVRGERKAENFSRERMRLLQRETNLERLVVDGRWTLLVVLEDVRPGDVIEAAFTLEGGNPLRAGACEAFFMVPPYEAVGRYRLRVVSAAGRETLRWKAAAGAPERVESSLADGGRCWSWEGAQMNPVKAEVNVPGSHLDYVWIEVSDWGAWEEISRLAADIWERSAGDAAVAGFAEFAKPEAVTQGEIERVLGVIYDGFRYLSIDMGSGGWVPARPGVVAARRYGDCKDLTWLAASVLRSWGVAARPVLVGTGLRERAAEMLPATLVFNHAILEITWEGRTRWLDMTERLQGGGLWTRGVSWFGQGLPVDTAGAGLAAQPGGQPASVYALRETVLLDSTRNAASLVEMRLRTEGLQADSLRRAYRAQGAEEFAKQREQQAQRRYGKLTKRAGALVWRDNPAANVCEVAEVFEVTAVLGADEGGMRAIFDVPPNLVWSVLAIPEAGERRCPWALPFPLELRHSITVKTSTMRSKTGKRRRFEERELRVFLSEPLFSGAWTKTCCVIVDAAMVPAERVPAHRKQLEAAFRELGWRLYLPWGKARPRRGEGFGQLPPEDAGADAYVENPDGGVGARGIAPVVKIGAGGRRSGGDAGVAGEATGARAGSEAGGGVARAVRDEAIEKPDGESAGEGAAAVAVEDLKRTGGGGSGHRRRRRKSQRGASSFTLSRGVVGIVVAVSIVVIVKVLLMVT